MVIITLDLILHNKIKINLRSSKKKQSQFDLDLFWPDLELILIFLGKKLSNGKITVIFEFYVEIGP